MEGILGVILLVLVIMAILRIVGSAASPLAKVLWSLLVIVLPVVGLIVWYFVGPK